MDIDAILADSTQKYPNGSNALENELRTLKRNLNVSEGFTCRICGKVIQHRTNYNRHLKTHETTYKCFLCQRKFNRLDSLKRHERGHLVGYVHRGDTYDCQHCGMGFQNYTSLFDHSKTMHPVQIGGNANITNHLTASQNALDDSVHVLTIYPKEEDKYDILTFFSNIRREIKDTLAERCDKIRHVKWYLNVHVELTRETNDGEVDNSQPYFKSKTYILLAKSDINDDEINEAFQKQFKSFDEYMARGSGWTLKRVIDMEVHTIQYRPLGGSAYFKIPKTLEKSHAVINIKNNDNKCFMWSILAHLHPKTNNPNRLSHYIRYENDLNMRGISYPVQVKQIPKFENQNDVSVNVFGFEEGEFFPIHISKHKNKRHEVDLLYLTKGDEAHYCYIKHLNRLLSRTKNSGRAYKFCRYCLRGFTSQRVLEKHLRYCSKQEAQHVEFPVRGSGEDIIEFDDFQKQMRVPFVIYCDFEAFARPIDTCLPNPAHSSTTTTVNYEACGYGYQVVCEDDRYSKPPVIYRGPGACQHLLDQLFKEEEYIKDVLGKIEPLNMSPTDEMKFKESTCCHICKKQFKSISEKVKDHSHLTGQFRGAAHNSCNLNYQHPDFIPVYFHNLRGFDSHLLMQGVGLFKGRKINVIPNNMERYVSFTLGSLRFVDSYQCLQSSLSNLVDDLVNEDPHSFKALNKEFPVLEEKNLLLRKGVYPYTYMDKQEKFSLTQLPSKEDFYNDLTKSHISDDDYDHAKRVWNTFKLSNMGEYHDLYLKTDVLLLNCVFERFRDQCLDTYGLDPAHYYTAPGLAFSSALKVSGCQLELITEDNADAYLFIESGLRGGISQISNRMATANNAHLKSTYDPKKETSYLIYQDCNNLYGLAMCMPLPTGGFRFLKKDERETFDAVNTDVEGDLGYIVEVDLEYPKELHDSHSDYPLAPETKKVSDDMISPYSHKLWATLNSSKRGGCMRGRSRVKTKKLLCTLEDKNRYICHLRNLQLYLQLGMRLKKIHRVLEFAQSPFMREYIELNTEKRKHAKGDFEKSFYKLMNNAVFGKTCENVRKRVDVQLITSKRKMLKQAAKSSFVRCEIFTKDLVAVQCKKTVLTLNKPIAIGMSVLELSKCVMYDYYYNYIKFKYGANVKLMMTDTDSLLLHIRTEDIYSDMQADKHLFDFSNYDKDHPLFDKTNAKKPGLFKDETAGTPVEEFVGLRSKMYSLVYGDQEQKRAKGVVKSVVRKQLKHFNYVKCILDQKNVMCQQNLIRSKKHNLQMVCVNKVALSAFDDKRYVMDNGVDTLAFGHYRIQEMK